MKKKYNKPEIFYIDQEPKKLGYLLLEFFLIICVILIISFCLFKLGE